MSGIQTLLLSFDHALSHPFESLAEAIKGVTEEESVWQHPAYSREPHDEGFGRPGTILWFLNHLEYYHRYYTAVLRNRPNVKSPQVALPGELPLKQVLPALEDANAGLREAIATFSDDDLDRPCTQNQSTVEFVHSVVRHIAWHSGQIATIRRLYAHRDAK